MPETPAFERLLKRDRAIAILGLAALCTLAWLYTVSGAGVGMTAWQMTTLSLVPHQSDMTMGMPGMAMSGAAAGAWGPATWALMIAMWWIMMIAMMAPSATPAILLYAAVHRHTLSQEQGSQGRGQNILASIGAFAAGYLLMWLGFSVIAALLHWVLERSGLVSAMMMGSQSRWLSASVLIVAGGYQLSPLKQACLSQCRAPASFLSRHWRPHALGALRLGVMHGAYCVGCCWMLMALLFVGGVMNLAWIAVLAVLVLLEKVLPRGQGIRRGTGLLLIAWGVATLFA